MTVGELKKLLSVIPDDVEVHLIVFENGEPNPAGLRGVTKWPCIVELVGNFDLDEEERKEKEERKRHES